MHHTCDHCQRQFDSADDLKRHRAELHPDLPLEPEEARNQALITTGTNLTGQTGTKPPPGTGGPATP